MFGAEKVKCSPLSYVSSQLTLIITTIHCQIDLSGLNGFLYIKCFAGQYSRSAENVFKMIYRNETSIKPFIKYQILDTEFLVIGLAVYSRYKSYVLL